MTPYITPQILISAALGIAWNTIPRVQSTPAEQYAEQVNICWRATEEVDNFCGMPLRAEIVDPDTIYYPGSYAHPNKDGSVRVMVRAFPVIKCVAGQWAAAGGPPYNWNTIPSANMAPEVPPFGMLGGSNLSSAVGGMNAIRIGAASLPFSAGIPWNGFAGVGPGGAWGGYGLGAREIVPIQLAYTAGWPHAGVAPSLTATGATTDASADITIVTTGIETGMPVYDSAGAFPSGTSVVSIGVGSITLSNPATQTVASDVLSFGYAPGATVLNVDDVTAWSQVQGMIFDAPNNETVLVDSVTPNTPGQTEPNGPGTVALAAPTLLAHDSYSVLSALPSTAQLAALYFAASQALVRGASSVTVPTAGKGPATVEGSGGIAFLTGEAQRMLRPYRRII